MTNCGLWYYKCAILWLCYQSVGSKGKFIPVVSPTMPLRAYAGVNAQLYAFLIVALNGGICATSSLAFFFLVRQPPVGQGLSFTRFPDHTQRRTTVGRTPLDEWSARRRDLYLTAHNTHSRQTSMPPVGFEPTISAGGRPQNYALDRAATGACLDFLDPGNNPTFPFDQRLGVLQR